MAPDADVVFRALRTHRLVSVIRAATADAALEAARAVLRGGIAFVEVTFTVPDAPSVMRSLAHEPAVREGRAIVGAGTVLTAAEARAAHAAGARFFIAPNLSPAVAAVARETGVLFCPGAYTTTEILAAMDAGAHLVKVYPVGVAGGPAYIQVIRDPLPHVPMLAAGGTNLDNVVPFLRAGCVACGLGASLADPALAMARRFDDIEARARAFVAHVAGEPVPA